LLIKDHLFCFVRFKLQRFDADQNQWLASFNEFPMQQKPAAAIGLFECKALLANGCRYDLSNICHFESHFQKSPGGRIAQRVENRDRCNPG